MTTKEMNLKLINTFPEMIQTYHNEVDWQEGDDTGSHVVYGDVLEPYIERLILEKNKQKLKDVFSFLESLLALKEQYIDEVISFSVIEKMIDKSDSIIYCKPLMGSMVKGILDELYKTQR